MLIGIVGKSNNKAYKYWALYKMYARDEYLGIR